MMHFAQPFGTAEQEREPLCELIVELGGTVVDEPHEPDPVFTVIRQLQGELLTHVAGADDHRVLRVAGQMPAE